MPTNDQTLQCSRCGLPMNHHAEKLIEGVGSDDPPPNSPFEGVLEQIHACPGCGAIATRRVHPNP